MFICVRPKRLTKQYPIAICINIYFIIFQHFFFYFSSSGLLSVYNNNKKGSEQNESFLMGDRSHSRDQEMNQRVNNRTCIMEWMIGFSEHKKNKNGIKKNVFYMFYII